MEGRVQTGTGRKQRRFGYPIKRFCRPALGVMTTACVAAAMLLLAGALVAPLGAQTYPNKPVRFILPYPPGGATDILGRIVSQKFADQFGQPFVPENRPGAGGNIGTEIAAKAQPDGYTIVLVSPALVISPGLYKKLNYDPIKDLAPISMVLHGPYVLLVRPGLPVKNLKEFVEYAKARPGKLNFGGGIGTPPHLAGELLNSLAKIKVTHVPYKGVNQAMIGLMSNEVDMVVIGTPAAIPQIQAGKVRPLAVLTEQRVPSLPAVPTTREAGIENYVVTSWYGIATTAGTPSEIVTRLNAEWVKIAAMPDTREKFQKVEFEPVSNTPEQFAEFIKTEIARWGKVIKEANLSVE